MAAKRFTMEELIYLKSSKYVLRATHNTVHFTAEFKEKAWDLMASGKTTREAVAELGIDPDVLGAGRLQGLRATLHSEVRKGNTFKDLETRKLELASNVPLDVKVKFLEQQLEYKDQEIEFLKKIVSLGKGGAG